MELLEEEMKTGSPKIENGAQFALAVAKKESELGVKFEKPRYHSHLGSFYYFFGDRFVCPPDAYKCVLIFLATLIPTLTVITILIPYGEYWSYITIATILSLALYNCVACSTKDPGIRRRRLLQGRDVDLMNLYRRINQQQAMISFYRTPEGLETLDTLVKEKDKLVLEINAVSQASSPDSYESGATVPLNDDRNPYKLNPERRAYVLVNSDKYIAERRFCVTCGILRGPRTSHCRNCDVCVEEFDHHCQIIGCCVAKRTFRHFTFYLFFTGLLSLYVLTRLTVELMFFYDWGALVTSVYGVIKIVIALAIVLLTGYLALFLIPLGTYYIILGALNLTTKEKSGKLRFWDRNGNLIEDKTFCGFSPYSRSLCSNLYDRFWSSSTSQLGRGEENQLEDQMDDLYA